MAGPLSPDETRVGRLPPFEVAKAYAFDVVVGAMEKHMGQSARALLGRDKGEFIASKLELQGGGQPTRQCVFFNHQGVQRTWVVPWTDHG